MKNVIVLLVDALRFDCILGYPAHGRDYTGLVEDYQTPTMSHIMDRGVVFSDCWTTHPYTSGACGSLATGRFPYKLGCSFNFVDSLLPHDIPTVGELLQRKGVTVKHHFDFQPFSHLYGLERGVDEVTYWDTERDANVIQWAKDQKNPFYLLWHLGDVHSPYLQSWDDPNGNEYYIGYMSAVMDEMGIKGERTLQNFWNKSAFEIYPHWREHSIERLIKLYVQGVQKFDTGRMARIWRGFQNLGILDDTLIVLMADHGEEFRQKFAGHGFSLHEDLLRIPLVLYHHTLSHRVESNMVRIVDVPTTILSIFEAETWGTDGVNLLNPVSNDLMGYAERVEPFMCEYDKKNSVKIKEQAARIRRRKLNQGTTGEAGNYIVDGSHEVTTNEEWSDLREFLRSVNTGRILSPVLKDTPQEDIDNIMKKMRELGYV